MSVRNRCRRKFRPLAAAAAAVILLGGAVVPAWLKPGYVECGGCLEPENWIPLYAPASGIIGTGLLEDGTLVGEGTLLLTMDDDWIRWNLDRARLECLTAAARAESLRRRTALFLRHRDIEENELLRLLDTDRKLQASSSLSMNELTHTEFLYRSYRSEADLDEAGLLMDLRSAETAVEEARCEEVLWTRRLEDCRLTAPASGVFYASETVLSDRPAALVPPLGPGRYLESGQFLGYIIPAGGMKARIAVPQDRIARCRIGRTVLVSPDARPRWRYPPVRGTLSSTASVTSGGFFTAVVSLEDAAETDDLRNLVGGNLTARIDVRNVDPETLAARIWEAWVLLVNPQGPS